jgi:hypothetical protein
VAHCQHRGRGSVLGLQSLRQGEGDAWRSGGPPSGLSPVALTRDRVRFLNLLEPLSHID